MRFNPMTEEELQVASLLPEGIYVYKVIESEDRVSQAGNDYVKITLRVWDGEGKEHKVFTNMALTKLLKHFCDVNGMENEYSSGDIAAISFMNKSGGMVSLKIEDAKPDGKGGMYKAKNIVHDYISESKPSSLMPLSASKTEEFIDSEIPF